MYFYSIEIGCGAYVILQGLRIYKEELWAESIYLVIAGIFGYGSLYATKYLHCWMACHLGAWSLEVSYLEGLYRSNVTFVASFIGHLVLWIRYLCLFCILVCMAHKNKI